MYYDICGSTNLTKLASIMKCVCYGHHVKKGKRHTTNMGAMSNEGLTIDPSSFDHLASTFAIQHNLSY